MVAYSFKKQFVAPILDGSKHQTIRADRKRHARPGEELQLYSGMRTKQCKLIRRATCKALVPVRLCFWRNGICSKAHMEVDGKELDWMEKPRFARSDGFSGVDDMADFWFNFHRETVDAIDFSGFVISWEV